MVHVKLVTLNSLGGIYGLRENDILCKPLKNGALEKDIPTLSKRPFVIEVWQAMPTSTRYLNTSMRIPGLKSGKIENPFMFTFPPEEPTMSKVEFVDQVPRYDVFRLAQSLVKKGTVCTGSLSQFNWRDLGLQVGMCYKSLPPNVSFLYGPLHAKYAPKEREKVCVCLSFGFEGGNC